MGLAEQIAARKAAAAVAAGKKDALVSEKSAKNEQITTREEDAAAIQSDLVDTAVDNTPVHLRKNHTYSTPHSEAYKLQLSGGDVTAVNGVLKVTDKQHEEIQELIASGRPDIAQNLIHLDVAAADKLAREYLAKMAPEAHRGGSHSGANAERNDATANRGPGLQPIDVKNANVPEGANASTAQRLAVNETLLDAQERHAPPRDGEEDVEAANRRAAALRLQSETNIHPKEEEAFHEDDLTRANQNNSQNNQ